MLDILNRAEDIDDISKFLIAEICSQWFSGQINSSRLVEEISSLIGRERITAVIIQIQHSQ